jgi:hypothetical protein
MSHASVTPTVRTPDPQRWRAPVSQRATCRDALAALEVDPRGVGGGALHDGPRAGPQGPAARTVAQPDGKDGVYRLCRGLVGQCCGPHPRGGQDGEDEVACTNRRASRPPARYVSPSSRRAERGGASSHFYPVSLNSKKRHVVTSTAGVSAPG